MSDDDYEDDFEVDETPNPNSQTSHQNMTAKPSWLDDSETAVEPVRTSDVFGIGSSNRPVSVMSGRVNPVARPSTSRGSRPGTAQGGNTQHHNSREESMLPPVPTHMIDGICVPTTQPVLSFHNQQQQSTTLGGGGFAVVQKGIYQQHPVAIKRIFNPVITAEMRAEYTNETKIIARLDKHPHIMPVYGMVPDKLALVMPEAEIALNQFILSKRKALLRHFTECALAVKHCHDKGVIHCDIKSHNFLIYEHRVTLIDFGTAQDTNELSVKPRDPVWQRGSPQYIAPEVYLALGTYGEAMPPAHMKARDVYALGILFVELITLTFAFEGLDVNSIKTKVSHYAKPSYPNTHTLAPLITRMLHNDHTQRATIHQVVEE